jgi:hypothetical protein
MTIKAATASASRERQDHEATRPGASRFTLKLGDHLDSADQKRFYNTQLFTEIAPRYDLITPAPDDFSRIFYLRNGDRFVRTAGQEKPQGDCRDDVYPNCRVNVHAANLSDFSVEAA